MSVQQCYENFFKSNIDFQRDPNDMSNEKNAHLDDYNVYASLAKLGYIIRRSSRTTNLNLNKNFTEPDKKIDQKSTQIESLINKSEHGKLERREIFNRLNNFIPNITLIELKKRIEQKKSKISSNFGVLFDVYLPNRHFKKSQPGSPAFNVSTMNKLFKEKQSPKLIDLVSNCSSDETRQLFAFVDNGDVSFYSFDTNLSLRSII